MKLEKKTKTKKNQKISTGTKTSRMEESMVQGEGECFSLILDHEFLSLNAKEFDKIYTIKRKSKLRFVIPFDTPILAFEPTLMWNYPLSSKDFERDKFCAVER